MRTYVSGVQPGPQVTPDVDAHLVESSKAEALMTYKGFRGYQPMLVAWAEQGLVLAEEFRDGNVPASVGIQEVVDRAYGSLPAREEGWQVAVRSDSAAYEQGILDHWAGRGWRFAVSADMTEALRKEVLTLPPEAWQAWRQERNGVVKEWAEAPYVPSRKYGARGQALSVFGHPAAPAPGTAVRGRQLYQALCGGHQRLGDTGTGPIRVASRQSGHHRAGASGAEG